MAQLFVSEHWLVILAAGHANVHINAA